MREDAAGEQAEPLLACHIQLKRTKRMALGLQQRGLLEDLGLRAQTSGGSAPRGALVGVTWASRAAPRLLEIWGSRYFTGPKIVAAGALGVV